MGGGGMFSSMDSLVNGNGPLRFPISDSFFLCALTMSGRAYLIENKWMQDSIAALNGAGPLRRDG